MTNFRKLLISLAAAGVVLAGAVPAMAQAPARQANCLSDQEIQTEIASGQIQSWPAIKKLAGISNYQEVSDVRVCMMGGKPFYEVNIVSPSGAAKKVMINALDGST